MQEKIIQRYNKTSISPLANGQIKTATRLSIDALEAIAERSNDYLPARVRFSKPELIGVDARDGTDNTRALSELGNAKRLEDANRGYIHYIPEARAWLHWVEGAWIWDDGAKARGLAAQLSEQIYDEGKSYMKESELFAKWARSSQTERVIKASISLLKDLKGISLPLALLDSDSYSVGINYGRQVIDLKSGAVRDAKQSDYITKSLIVDRLGNAAQAERWLLFLDQVFNEDAELISWIKRWCGYLLTGSTNEQIFTFCYGQGANGKSVFGDILRYIVGDYARVVAPETIAASKRQAGGASPDLADLIGARLAISSETEDGVALAESLVKSLVAGDTLTVRKLYGAQTQFTPKFKLMILGNHRPVIKGTDYGIWRRVRMVPFNRTFSPDERDPHLFDKLRAEAPHILAWMIEGCIEWQQSGLTEVPAIMRNATSAYQEEQDLIGLWLSECCDKSTSNLTSSTVLYNSYKDWCDRNGIRPESNIALGRKLPEYGFKQCKLNQARGWIGVAIKNIGEPIIFN